MLKYKPPPNDGLPNRTASHSSLCRVFDIIECSLCVCVWFIRNTLSFFLHLCFNWSLVDLQCVNFCCTTKWFSYIHIYILFYILFHSGLFQDIECSSLCYTVGPCLSILYVIVCIYQPQTPKGCSFNYIILNYKALNENDLTQH